MIRRCNEGDFDSIHAIIKDIAQAYRGVIPEDCWHEPYMPAEELRAELGAGVIFWGYADEDGLQGVMGLQPKGDVYLIRHAYVKTVYQNRGIGSMLLQHLYTPLDKPVLIGTWVDAGWAIRFYQRNGFFLLSREEKDRLLQKYWSISKRQADTSVVLADAKWMEKIILKRGAPGTMIDTKLPELKLRFARKQDTGIILGFIKELAEYENMLPEVTATEEILRESLFERRSAEVIIAEYRRRPVGFALFFHNFSTFLGRPGIYLEDLYVQSKLRGKGIGQIILAYLAKLAVERKCGRLEWWCLDWNQSSIMFYKRMGAKAMTDWTVYRVCDRELQELAQSFETSETIQSVTNQ
jgi:GNAT superfamily N-acetyltransferase